MTLKLKGGIDILKMYLYAENECANLGHSKNTELEFKQNNMSKGQRSRSKCQKLQITLSVIVTDIQIKPRQFLACSI